MSSIEKIAPFTPAEYRVLRLCVAGLTSREAGERLKISPRTVEAHKRKLLAKSGCRNLAQLAYAYGKGKTWSNT